MYRLSRSFSALRISTILVHLNVSTMGPRTQLPRDHTMIIYTISTQSIYNLIIA